MLARAGTDVHDMAVVQDAVDEGTMPGHCRNRYRRSTMSSIGGCPSWAWTSRCPTFTNAEPVALNFFNFDAQ
jgi:hypothetical protein